VLDPAPERILVRAPNWVGDVVMATASMARLRRGFPDAHVTVAARPYLRSLLSGSDTFDEFLPAPKAGGLRGLLRQVREVRRRRFDLAVIFPNSLETGLVPWLAGVPERLGYRQGREWVVNRGLKAEPGRTWWKWWQTGPRRIPSPMPLYYQELLDVLGLPEHPLRPELAVTDQEEEWLGGWLRERGVDPGDRLLLITVGASFGASKLWLPERFAAVGRAFRDRHGMVPVILAGPAEVELARTIAADIGERAVHTVDPVVPLGELKAVVRRGSLMVTGDTGPRHLGIAFDVPTVVLMGPNDPRYTDYCMERTALIHHDELECVPCQRPVCPLGTKECMHRITIDEVVAAGERLLAASSAGGAGQPASP